MAQREYIQRARWHPFWDAAYFIWNPVVSLALNHRLIAYTTSVIFLDDSEELRLQPIFANSSENVSGLV